MTSPDKSTGDREPSLAEFFAEIEAADGPAPTAADHRDLVAAVRDGRDAHGA